MSNFSEFGPKLAKLGYEIIPIAEGEKYPKGIPEWQSIKVTKDVLTTWNKRHPTAGVGIRCANTPAIDIDVYDKEIAGKLSAWVREHLDGEIVERIGQSPKTLFPVRTAKKFSKKKSSAYTDIFGAENCIEILGDGQQFVAYHIHPDTNKEYYYVSEKALHEVKQKDLPLVTEEFLDALFDYYDSIVPESWHKKGARTSSGITEGGDLMGFAPKADIDDAEIEKLLSSLPNDDFSYDTYLQVGMGLHHQYGGSEDGYSLWSHWCNRSDKNDDNTNRFKWKSFGNNTSLNPVTLKSVVKLAHQHEVEVEKKQIFGEDEVPGEAEDLKEFLKRYAYMPEDNQIVDLQRPLRYALMPIASFKNLTANRRTEVPDPVKADEDRVKMVPTANLWLTNSERMTVEGTEYQPKSEKRIVRAEDGRLLMNMAHFPDHKTIADDQDYGSDGWRMDVFNRHMEYLFPKPEQRLWFVQWLAFIVQRPQQRCKVTPLHVSKPHGTGRGWVVNLIESLVGNHNVSKTSISEMCGEGSKGQYEDYLYRTLVCCVEEVKASEKRYSVSDQLRDKMTELRLNVNLKYGGKATIDVHTNFFWMSNHEDAVILPKEDRRTHVLEGPDFVHPGEYYDELYNWLNVPANVAYLWSQLKETDLTSFEWKVAPITEGRQRMIDYTMSSTEDVFGTWLAENEKEWMLFEDIKYELGCLATRDGVEEMLSDPQIRKLLQQNCYQYKQMRLSSDEDRRVRPWYLGAESNPERTVKQVREALG